MLKQTPLLSAFVGNVLPSSNMFNNSYGVQCFCTILYMFYEFNLYSTNWHHEQYVWHTLMYVWQTWQVSIMLTMLKPCWYIVNNIHTFIYVVRFWMSLHYFDKCPRMLNHVTRWSTSFNEFAVALQFQSMLYVFWIMCYACLICLMAFNVFATTSNSCQRCSRILNNLHWLVCRIS